MAEFTDAIIKIIDKKIKTIDTAELDLYGQLNDVEKIIFEDLKKAINKLNVEGGKIQFDEKNIDLVNELDRVMIDAIQGSNFPSAISKYLRNFQTISDFNFDVHNDVNDLSKTELEKLVSPVQKLAVETTLNGLTGSGVNTNFIEPVRQGIFQNIVAGTNRTELEEYLRNYVLGNPNVDGLYSRYVKQVTRDALGQFDGQTNARIADEFGLDAFRYVGSLIDDSRPQCRRWIAKRVLQKSELQSEINWANNNGTGMIGGTTPENFPVYRGGYNCRHAAIPFKLTKSQREKLNLPEEQQKIEQKVAAATDEIGKVPAEKDFPDLYTFESKLTPKKLKGVQGISEYIYELSDNGRFQRTNSSGAFYNQNKLFINVPVNSRYNDKWNFNKVIVHEYGHRTHFEEKYFLNRANHNPKHEKKFNEAKKIVDKKFNTSTDWDSIESKYIKKFKGLYNESEVKNMVTAYADTIEALTDGRFGFGHGKKYQTMDLGSYARFEFFAHCSENYWVGNPIFQFEFPELHEFTLKYYRDFVIKPKYPNIK